jgi:AhpC/TSA family
MRTFSITLAIILMTGAIYAQSADGGRSLDTPPPPSARDLVQRGIELASQDRVDEAIAAIARYKDRGFEIMAVSTDDANEQEKVREFARSRALPFPVLYDDGVARLYDIDSYPGNVFIGRDGNVKYSQNAFEDDRRLEILLDELLK